MVDLLREELVRLRDVPKLKIVPTKPGGKRVHRATVYRWVRTGLLGVRLATVRIGGSRCTSVEAVCRFIDELSHRSLHDPGEVPSNIISQTKNSRSPRPHMNPREVQAGLQRILRNNTTVPTSVGRNA